MNILGVIVNHRTFGAGTIIKEEDNHIVISFPIGEKTFQFPEAFDNYLSTVDFNFLDYIQQLRMEKDRREAEIKLIRAEEEKERAFKVNTGAIRHKGLMRSNIAFKCNYCDGGRSDKQVGFDGVCSDPIIYNNIAIEHRTWCNSGDCPCLKYFNGLISREELEEQCEDGGFICYESQMLRDWKALAGTVQNRERKGDPMKLQQVQMNSLCVLTTRDPGTSESDRFIFGVFLVDDTYEGDGRDEGYVSTTSKYKLKLSPKEAQKILFWDYHSNSNNPETPAWNSGLHRYFQDYVAVQILRDVVEIKKATEDYILAKEFLNYFCDINRVDISEVDLPYGALKR